MTLKQWVRESGAVLTQFRYLHRDLAPEFERHSDELVVLLHGLYASAGVLRPLRELLVEKLDASILTFSYVPGPGILELSERLARLLEAEKSITKIHLVGHSLGGLVARNFANNTSDPRVVQTVSIGSPFHGSELHYLVPGQAGEDLRFDNPLLERLRTTAGTTPHFSIFAGDDKLILPGATPTFGDVVTVPNVGHNGLIFDERVHALVCERLRAGPGSAGSL